LGRKIARVFALTLLVIVSRPVLPLRIISQQMLVSMLFGEDMQPMLMRNKLRTCPRTFFGCALILASVSGPGLATIHTYGAAPAQASTAAAPSNRFLGTITSAGSGLITVKTDAGVEHKVTVPDGIKIQRIAPGAKDLSNAATIPFGDLAVGDRVLVRIAPAPATDPVTAISIVAIPQADLAQKQQQEREDWQRNGVGGLVKSVNAGTGNIEITSGAGPTQKTLTLRTTPTTVLKRYAPNSVDFDQAKPAPIETIQVGDQLRAHGTKSADGLEVAAVEVVSGSFRNISGVISSVNPTAMTISLKDLITKHDVTVHIGSDAQMRKLPENMAKVLASMTKPGGDANAAGNTGAVGGGQTASGGQAAAASRPSYGGQGGQGSGDAGQGKRGGDLQQMLSRAPAIHLSDLQKGDAVMLVSTEGTSEVTAITLLSGVEPLLQAPASTQNMLLSNWSMSSGGAEAAQ
jgi:hypothetical protein